MGYQNAPATITVTRDGERVVWIVDYSTKTFTAIVRGETVGTWPTRTAGIEELGLIEVAAPKKGKRA
jgi:hypothetical protein